MSIKNIVILAEHADEVSFTAVVEQARRQGFHVESIIPEIGTLIGTADERVVEAIKSLKGVESVSEEDFVQVPFPDSGQPV